MYDANDDKSPTKIRINESGLEGVGTEHEFLIFHACSVGWYHFRDFRSGRKIFELN